MERTSYHTSWVVTKVATTKLLQLWSKLVRHLDLRDLQHLLVREANLFEVKKFFCIAKHGRMLYVLRSAVALPIIVMAPVSR